MNPSHEQIQAIENGEPMTVTIAGARCVVIREDVYDRMKRALEDEDLPSSLTVSKMMSSVTAEDDADDPALESYQRYKKHP